MLTAKQALEATRGATPLSDVIPKPLMEQLDNAIRMAALAEHTQCVIVVEAAIYKGLAAFLRSYSYTVEGQPGTNNTMQIIISWSSILIPSA